MADSTGMTRLESFPFDSHADGYDADGYPVYDRAVGASTLRKTFAAFFTSGVFDMPDDALMLSKGSDGLSVNVSPGMCIIDGAMGGVTGDDPITITLDTEPPQGNVCYAVMLRLDDTDSFNDSRSILINVVRGDAASSPHPPEPDVITPGVHEMRLGYVMVPSGATDMSGAMLTVEKGTQVCPYAAPFERIDVSYVVELAKSSATQALADLNAYIDANRDFIDSAIAEGAAGEIQAQINALADRGTDSEFLTYILGKNVLV